MHTIADFYSHSNYIDLYVEYAGDNFDANKIPTLTESMNNEELSGFKATLENNLKTLEYGKGTNTKNPDGSKNTNHHNNSNLDSPNKRLFQGGKGHETIKGTDVKYHDAAANVATKEITDLLKSFE